MLLKSGLRLFIKKPVLNVIIILQLSVTVVLTNLIIGLYNVYDEAFTLTKKFPAHSTCFVMNTFDSNTEKKQELLSKYQDAFIVEQLLDKQFYIEDNSKDDTEAKPSFETIGYGEKTSEYVTIPLKEGCWFTEAESEDCVPCVVRGEEYNVGDIIRLSIQYEPTETYKEPITEEEALLRRSAHSARPGPVTVSFKVVGVLQHKYRILDFNGGSNNLTLDRLFQERTDLPVLLFKQKELEKFGVPVVFYPNSNFILYLQTEDPSLKQNIINEFRNVSWISPFEDAYEASEEELSSNVKKIMLLAISVLLIGLVSAICIIFLNAYNHIRVFSVYYICGMKWKKGFMIIFPM